MKRKRHILRLLPILLTFVWCGTMNAGSWGDEANRSKTKTRFEDFGGLGTSSSPHLISSAQDLAQFAYLIRSAHNNWGEGKYFKLTTAIDLSTHTWVPIGSPGNSFRGHFDGGNFVINNLKIDTNANEQGLFSSVWGDGTLKNIILENVNINPTSTVGYNIGGIAGVISCTGTTIENCHVRSGKIRGEKVGGLVGLVYPKDPSVMSYPRIIKSSCGATITPVKYDGGGLIGKTLPHIETTISDCLFYGTLNYTSGVTSIGGIVGYSQADLRINNSVMRGTLNNFSSSYATSRLWGVIVGGMEGSTHTFSNVYKNNSSSDVGNKNGCTVTGSAINNTSATSEFAYNLNKSGGGNCWTIKDSSLRNDQGVYMKKITCNSSSTFAICQVNNASTYYEVYTHESSIPILMYRSLSDLYEPKFSIGGGSIAYSGNDGSYPKYTVSLSSNYAEFEFSHTTTPIPKSTGFTGVFDQWKNEINLTWDNGGSYSIAGEYQIYRKRDSSSWEKLKTVAKTVKSYTDTSIEYDKAYTYGISFVKSGHSTPDIPLKEATQINTKREIDIINFVAAPDTIAGERIMLSFEITNKLNSSNASHTYSILRRKNNGEFVKIVDGKTFAAAGAKEGLVPYKYEDSDDLGTSCDTLEYQLSVKALGKEFLSSIVETNVTAESALSSLKVTKGEYSNMVRLSWETKKLSAGEIERYKVLRSIAKEKLEDEQWTELATINTADAYYSYIDDKALPGIYYNYKIELMQNCLGNYKTVSEKQDIGYSQSTGTVSGRITYGSGTSVEGVNVLVKRNNLENSESQYQSLYSDGGGGAFKWTVDTVRINNLFNEADFTIQFWLNPLDNETGGLLGYIGNVLKLELTGNKDSGYQIKAVPLSGSGFSLLSENTLPTNKFSHITLTRKGNVLSCYVVNENDLNKILLESTSISNFPESFPVPIPISSTRLDVSLGYTFNGYIDECRLWSKALTESEILRDYNRILTGGESGLTAYWTFDDVIKEHVFDISRVGTIYNGNHAIKTINSSTIVPADSQLALKAITDADGNYQVRGIPYSGEGSSYEIVPTFGIHQFQPSKHLRYISGTSMVHNGTDFDDVSSFKVKGTVHYNGTNYPVDSVQINIDGVAASRDGQLIMTNQNGEFEVDVPIGEHFISVFKQGHVFESGGRYPAGIAKYNFQNDINGMKFLDNTTIRIAGRVSGGVREPEKEIGFALSKANIGQATVSIIPQSDLYSLYYDNVTDTPISGTKTIRSEIGGKEIVSQIKNESKSSVIEITTDSQTGEFIVELPPVPYRIADVKTNSGSITGKDKFQLSAETFNPNVNFLQTNEYTNEDTGAIAEFNYHEELNIVYRSEPQFAVTDMGNPYGLFGDSIYLFSDPAQDILDAIPLYNSETREYTLGYPVFTKQNKYRWNIFAYEAYENRDNPENAIEDIVPLAGLEVNVNNALSSMRVDINTTDNTATLTESENTILLNDEGKATYAFIAGFPNLNGDNLLAAKMSFVHNGKTITWKDPNDDFKGIVVGDVPTDGNNFVTQGPDMVDFILRDPGGSSSYAYLEKGSVINTENSFTNTAGLGLSAGATLKLGGSQTVVTGVGVALEIKTATNLDVKAEVNTEASYIYGNTSVTSTEINQRIQTSDSDDFVSSNADIYFGKSTNLVFGLVRNLGFYPNPGIGEKYKLNQKEILSTGIEFETTFTYTQDHILNTLIPNMFDLRNSLLQYTETDIEQLNISPESISERKYYTNLNPEDKNYGQAGTYKVFYPKMKKGEVLSDQVMDYNNWIGLWEQTIANNEEAKIEAFAKGKAVNKSFDAGAVIEESITTTESSKVSHGYTAKLEVGVSTETGFEVNDFGFKIETKQTVSDEVAGDVSNETEESITIGYVLADDSRGDAYSIDVYEPQDKGGHIFRTIAGQTACPHEAEERTLFFKPGEHTLNYGTFQIEKPELFINDTKETSAENIPSGREASFVVQMSNQSETKSAVTYQLQVSDDSNNTGLILSIDGTPLTSPRNYYIEYGNTIEKVLKVRQSSVDVLDYSDVVLQLVSTCDDNIGTEASISVNFIPSSTDLKLKSSSTLVNDGLDGKIEFTINEYDRQFKNFASIRLQYKNIYSQEWTTVREFINNESLIELKDSSKQELIGNKDEITYKYDLKENSLTDGAYDFRAISVAKLGNDEILVSSEEIRIIKDTKAPQLLGSASPVNGILNPGNEISVQFNEDIRSEYILPTDISVKAIMNGHKIAHSTAARFTGGAPAATESTISLANRSFSIESWFIRDVNKEGTLFAHGKDFSLGFNATNKVVVNIAGETFTSDESLNNGTWQYIAFAYDNDAGHFSVYSFAGSETKTMINAQPIANAYQESGRLYVGAKADQSEAFTGAIHNLTLWNKARFLADMSDKDIAKSGNEKSLIGYWPLTEGKGTVASDKARNRHLIMPTANYWYLNNVNKAFAFNGISNYLVIPAGDIPISTDESFALEFWFKGEAQSNAVLFSCGEGIEGKLSINFDENGKLNLHANNSDYRLSDKDYLDNSWHHFALNAIRTGSVVAYVDGEAIKQFSNSLLSGMITNFYTLGADYDGSSNANSYFNGSMDELRVWKADITAEVIRQNIYNRLSGDEDGLLIYFPFEKTRIDDYGQPVTESTLHDCCIGSDKEASGTGNGTDQSPALKEVRVLESVSHTFTASSDKVVITITEPISRIENTTLEFTARGILDLNNNVLSQPIYWNAYVNMNQLKWGDNEVILTKEYLEEKSFEMTISNQSGKSESWVISNLPSWLTVSKQQGTLNSLSSEKLVFTVKSSTAIGSYEEVIYLTGNNQMDEILAISLKVTAEKPDWSVDPVDFEFSMNLIGQLKFENVGSEDEEDLVAAFIDTVCVGVASPAYLSNYDAYFIAMDIYGNNGLNNKEIIFKAWDASTGQIYPVVSTSVGNITFTSNKLVGSMNYPVELNAENLIEQQINLNKGWNWISINADVDDKSIDNVFASVQNKSSLLKNKTSFAIPSGDSWEGSLQSATIGQMYKLSMQTDAIFRLAGRKVNLQESPVSINKGWNWIGYIPQFSLSIEDALSDLEPEENDLVKGQSQFAVYTRNGWLGSLTTMAPGKGYLYQSNSNEVKTFHYPSVNRGKQLAFVQSAVETYWTPVDENTYSGNMTIIANVKEDNEILLNCELAAFVGQECRGSVRSDENGFLFLTVAGEESNVPLSIKVYIVDKDEVVDLNEMLIYNDDAMLGSIGEPYIIQLNQTGLSSPLEESIQVYPTLVTTKLNISSSSLAIERIVINDMSGRVVKIEDNLDKHINVIDVSNLMKGAYLVSIETKDRKAYVVRIMK